MVKIHRRVRQTRLKEVDAIVKRLQAELPTIDEGLALELGRLLLDLAGASGKNVRTGSPDMAGPEARAAIDRIAGELKGGKRGTGRRGGLRDPFAETRAVGQRVLEALGEYRIAQGKSKRKVWRDLGLTVEQRRAKKSRN